MARPYSARFMSGRGGKRKETFVVPEGQRAVIRHLFFGAWGAAGQAVGLDVHGIPLYLWQSPGAGTQYAAEVRFVAYERETIQIQVVGNDCSYAIDGFLFADPDGTPDDDDNIIVPTLGLEVPEFVRTVPR